MECLKDVKGDIPEPCEACMRYKIAPTLIILNCSTMYPTKSHRIQQAEYRRYLFKILNKIDEDVHLYQKVNFKLHVPYA